MTHPSQALRQALEAFEALQPLGNMATLRDREQHFDAHGKAMMGLLAAFSPAALRALFDAADRAPSAPGAQPEPLCACKDRPADKCPGEWEPGCDLGNNAAHARVYTSAEPDALSEHLHGAGQKEGGE